MCDMEISKLYEVFKSCNSVFTDTRKIIKGGIYFALKGDNFDGNDFANEAIKNGAKTISNKLAVELAIPNNKVLVVSKNSVA